MPEHGIFSIDVKSFFSTSGLATGMIVPVRRPQQGKQLNLVAQNILIHEEFNGIICSRS